ncbi:DUF1942 domain-containing protein [Gordonia sp. CPCC 206044]|uniref:DUF1942 domain-containing protein n=1 Tax=Gordonia sp. CPCC 206044 TaxID=3140793 RepID=UPI003AF3E671
MRPTIWSSSAPPTGRPPHFAPARPLPKAHCQPITPLAACAPAGLWSDASCWVCRSALRPIDGTQHEVTIACRPVSAVHSSNTLNCATLTSTTMTVTVTVEATKGEMPVNPLYFIAKTADGTTFDPTYVDGNTTLHSGDLPAGEKVRGAVAFAVHGARPSALIYEAPLGEQLAKWTITWRAVKPAPKPAIPFGS